MMPIKDPSKRAEYHKKYMRERYQNNARFREEHKKRVQLVKKKLHAEMRKWLKQEKDKPCVDCGEKHPHWAMDFDHRNPKKKAFEIGRVSASGSWGRLKAEIEKCDLVCALCHRYRTFGKRRGVVV